MSRFITLVTRALALSSCLILGFTVSQGTASKPKPEKPPKFDREQMILLNLNRGPKSTGVYLAQALKQTHALSHQLDKARQQLEQADRSFAKFKGHPDDHYLDSPSEHLKQAEATAQQLEAQLKDSYQDLKSSVQEALVKP